VRGVAPALFEKGDPIMSNPKPTDRERRETETAEEREKQGQGTVPNVTPGAPNEQLVEALHQREEEKGDWSKGGG
jgi:hypothetical protein